MAGFEGIGDFDSPDPWQRYIAHQAAKGNLFACTPDESAGLADDLAENPVYGPGNPDWEHDREREDKRGL